MGIAAIGGGTAQGKAVTSLTTGSYTSTKGNRIVVTVHEKGTVTGTTPTDIVGSVYSELTSVNNGTTDRSELWGAISAASGSNAVSKTFSPGQTFILNAEEFSSSGAFGNTGSNTGTGTSATVAVTMQDLGNWIVGGAGGNGTATFSMSSPNVQDQTNVTSGDGAASNMGGDQGHQATTSPGSVTLTATLSASEVWTMVAVELRFIVLASQPVTTGTSIIKTVGKPVSQPVTTLTTSLFVLTKAGKTMIVTQPVTTGTSLVKTIVKVVSQGTTVATAVTNLVTKPVSQSITVFSSGVFLHIRFLTVTQPITVGTTFVKTVVKIVSQPVTTGTSVIKTVTKPVSQPITVGTSVIKTVTKPVSQPVMVSTGISKVVTKILSQGVVVLTTGTFTIPSLGPKILKVTQPVTVLTVFVASGQNRGYFWGPGPPSSPALAAVWMDTTTNLLKKWNGSGWVVVP